MFANYSASLARTLKWEGGYSNNPKDPGGATMHGVTFRTYNAFRSRMGLPPADVRHITPTELQAIYQTEYWDCLRCSQLASGVDLVVFDAAVNSGVYRAHQWLLQSLGGTAVDTVHRYSAKRLGFLHALRTWGTFGRGWASRVADMEAGGVRLASGANAPQVLQKAHQDALKKAARHSGTAVGTGGSVASVGASTHGLPWEAWGAIGTLGFLVLCVCAYFYHIHTLRAQAFAKEATFVNH